MKIKTFDELKESSITQLVWTAMANDMMDDLLIKNYDFFVDGKTFDSLPVAIDSILDKARSTPEKHKCANIDDYGLYSSSKIDDIAKDYGFKDVKLGTKVNKHGEVYVLIKSKKLTKGFMKRFYKDPYFIAGKITY